MFFFIICNIVNMLWITFVDINRNVFLFTFYYQSNCCLSIHWTCSTTVVFTRFFFLPIEPFSFYTLNLLNTCCFHQIHLALFTVVTTNRTVVFPHIEPTQHLLFSPDSASGKSARPCRSGRVAVWPAAADGAVRRARGQRDGAAARARAAAAGERGRVGERAARRLRWWQRGANRTAHWRDRAKKRKSGKNGGKMIRERMMELNL